MAAVDPLKAEPGVPDVAVPPVAPLVAAPVAFVPLAVAVGEEWLVPGKPT